MTHFDRRSRNKQKSKANAARTIIHSVIRLEKLVWKVAQLRDADAFAELVPSDAVMIFQSGIVSQPEYLATMRQRTISRYELGKIRGYMPNAKTVILLYEALRLGEEAGRTFPEGTVIESTTWIKRGRRWVAILNQETLIHAPRGSQTS
jgi:transcriptional regulator with XRE-family HTH domain